MSSRRYHHHYYYHPNAIILQKAIAKKVITKDDFGEAKLVCGVDVAYEGDIAYCSAVVMDKDFNLVESSSSIAISKHPYIPGLLMLREAEPIFHTLKLLKCNYDLLIVDGHGLLHPRKCGLACYVGVMLDKPTIGAAKSLLCGKVRSDGLVEHDGQLLGYKVNKKLYVSVGHRISLASAVGIIKQFTRMGCRVPEPLRIADINSKQQKRRRKLFCYYFSS